MDKETSRLTKMLKQGVQIKQPRPSDFLSTGSTLLNLGCSGSAFGGFAKGFYYFIVGDSSSGKTFLSLTCFAEAMRNRSFQNYRLIFDDVEGGAQMDIERYFGARVAERMEPASEDGSSSTIEDFYDNISAAIQQGDPFIYVLDSENALTSEDSDEKFEENRKKREAGKETKGSYGDGKAKKHSENMRRICRGLRKTNSILIVLSQTRDNINAIGFGDTKTRSGGRALKFYATLEMWSSVIERIKRRVRGRERVIGTTSKVKFSKNRFCGFEDFVTVDHYKDTGFDDIGSCIDFLVEEKHWKLMSDGTIAAHDMKFRGTREALIGYIEARSFEKDLSLVVQEVWNQVQEECRIERKRRYD